MELTQKEIDLLQAIWSARGLELWLMDIKERQLARGLHRKGFLDKGHNVNGRVQFSVSGQGWKFLFD